MAQGGPPFKPSNIILDDENLERLKKIRRLRELFHDRFPDKQCGTLLRKFQWDLPETVTFVLDEEPSKIREVLGEDEWQIVRRGHIKRNEVGAEFRQFGCKHCDNMWWREVPKRKPVTRCKKCNKKRYPIPKDRQYGWAKFECDCSNEFYAFGMMDMAILEIGLTGKSKSLCWGCRIRLCEPLYILKPEQNGRGGRRSRNTHECTAYNCYRRCPQRQPNEPIVPYCVHPKSLQFRGPGDGSDSHLSTGSTVKTFLT